VYSLLRFFTLIFPPDLVPSSHRLILLVSGLTLLVGILGAIPQNNLRKSFSFILVSHVGYLLAGIGLFSPLAMAGSLFYLIHDIVAKTGMFLFAGLLERLTHHSDISAMGGVYRSHPGIAWLFVLLVLAVSGIPPLSGFWGKLMLIQAGIAQKEYGMAALLLVAGFLTLYALMKVWSEVLWKDRPEQPSGGSRSQGPAAHPPPALVAPVTLLVAFTLLMGVWPGPFHAVASAAARELFNADLYIRAVLEARP
jgi:multicomponent Na+:H+ antiporter subunit D